MQTQLLKLSGRVSNICKRDLGVFAPALQKASDPIQQLFLDKIKEYRSKASAGKIDLTPDVKKELQSDRERIYKQFNTKPEDLTQFPSLNFADPKIQKYEI